MLTVTELARRCGISRTTLLYYETEGLLQPAARGANNYRRYGEKDVARLKEIREYREAGLKIADIRDLLSAKPPTGGATAVLERRLVELNREIEQLRAHQQSILKLLRHSAAFRRTKVITKEKWVAVMRAAGLNDDDMHRWHTEFEKAAPAEHQEFLEFLHIPSEEISKIREWSRKGNQS